MANVDELLETETSLERRCDPGVVDLVIRADVAADMRQYEINGINIAAKDAAERLDTERRKQHDEKLSADLIQFHQNIVATDHDLEARIAASRVLPPQRDDSRELVWYRRLEGRTLGELADAY